MDSTHGLSKGNRILLTKVTNSQKRYGLDDSGYMKGMIGKVWPIREISGMNGFTLYCEKAGRSFTFSIRDAERPVIKEPDPIIFQYDPQHLDI